tara:strand:- start:1058 stop:1345 length:288 start_codon:yes stop_codon:yes gene_type:complete
MNLFNENTEVTKVDTWENEWQGMPEYINIKPKEPLFICEFKFKNEKEYNHFLDVVKKELYNNKRIFDGKQLKNKKSAWYPLPARPSEHIYINKEK